MSQGLWFIVDSVVMGMLHFASQSAIRRQATCLFTFQKRVTIMAWCGKWNAKLIRTGHQA
ncbi:MAG: hypothetical protein CTY22_00230 [Methylomonas sp.]|nr:MAG: hypothetical protein CTY23_01350 [Methylomonas sp.]PPD27870.1 MAG: hypothetical protein CTY22_00230 [Methylomonas sp.]PPD39980.1 MAG: hypothetical protein CTY21_00230 [Methylomonas sp.]PPD41040.1 MAG: hypothetical protein CTY17_04635 [Methylomonas sp.]PPD52026.1 MAG: hypothetical protein CTY11_10460 [Methylomonas sp.]